MHKVNVAIVHSLGTLSPNAKALQYMPSIPQVYAKALSKFAEYEAARQANAGATTSQENLPATA